MALWTKIGWYTQTKNSHTERTQRDNPTAKKNKKKSSRKEVTNKMLKYKGRRGIASITTLANVVIRLHFPPNLKQAEVIMLN